MNKQFYQVGGSLPANAKSYIKREADDKLYAYLKEGKYAYVLNARQVGKSSLRVHTSKRLEEEGYSCVNIDLTSIGSEDITADEWYFSFVYQIIEQLGLEEEAFIEWWDSNSKLTIVNRFSKVFDKFILEKSQKNIIIMIDEVDSILGIKKDFSANDFFAVIRTFYNLRSEDERYSRVTFALFGVATPEDLMRDSSRTPFNIAHSVKIEQFKLEESLSLLDGLESQQVDSRVILEKIFEWTSGTPYLTQKILDYIVHHPIERVEEIDTVVDILFIQENFKEINISNIQNRILSNNQYSIRMLYLIGKIISDEEILADDGSLEQIYLKLSGLVKEKGGVLLYTNKIYQQLFNQTWLDESMSKIDRPFAKDLQRWVELNRTNSALLKGEVLVKAIEWASQSVDLTFDENEYLRLSIQGEQEQLLEEERKRGQSKVIKLLFTSLLIISAVLVILVNLYFDRQKFEQENKLLIETSTSEIDKRLDNMKIKKYTDTDSNSKYLIPDSIDEEVNIDKTSKGSYTIKEKQLEKDSALVHLIIHIRKENFDAQLWLGTLKAMEDNQKERLFKNLKFYAYINHASLFWKDGQYKESINYYKKAIEIDPEDISTYETLVSFYKEKYTQKDKTNETVVSQNQESDQKDSSTFEIATEILSYFQKMTINSKRNVNVYKSLADIYKFLGDDKRSLESFQKIIEIYATKPLENDKKSYIYRSILEIYEKDKKYDEAIIYFEKIVEKNSKDTNAYQRIGYLYKFKKEYKKALKAYKKVIEIYATKILANNEKYYIYQNILEIYQKTKKYDEAIVYFKKIVETDLKDANAYQTMGHLYRLKKEYKKSLNLYQKVIEVDSSVSFAYSYQDDYGRSYYNSSQNLYQDILTMYQEIKVYDKAIVYFNEQLVKNVKDVNAYQSLGDIYERKEAWDKALVMYKKVLEVNQKADSNEFYDNPYKKIITMYKQTKAYDKVIVYFKNQILKNSKDVNAYQSLGDIYKNREKFNHALTMYKKVIEINPPSDSFKSYYSPYKQILAIYKQIKGYDKATVYFKNQIIKNSKDVNAYQSLGDIYKNREEYSKALTMYKKVIEINSSDISYRLYKQILAIYKEIKGYDKAIVYFKNQIIKNSKDANAYQSLGDIYKSREEYSKALTMYKKVIEINPSSTYYSYYNNPYKQILAIYKEIKGYDKAVAYFKEQIIKNSKDVNAYQSLGDIYKSREEYDKALEMYKKIIKINDISNSHRFSNKLYQQILAIYKQIKEYDKAIVYFKERIIKNSKDTNAYQILGDIYTNREEYDKALEMYKKNIEINEASIYYDPYNDQYKEILTIYKQMKAYAKAIVYFKEQIIKNSKDSNAYQSLGDIYQAKEEYGKALLMYNRMVEINSQSDSYSFYTNSYKEILIIYKKTKEYNNAIAYFKKQIRKNLEDASAYKSLGDIYQYKEEYDKALTMYKKVHKLHFQYYLSASYFYYDDSYRRILKIYEKTKKYDSAIVYFNNQIEKKLDNANTYEGLGDIYKDKKEYINSLSSYKKAIEISSKNRYKYYGNLYDKVSFIYQKTKEFDNAIDYFKEQIEKNPKEISIYQKLGDSYRYKKEYSKAFDIYLKMIEVNFKNNPQGYRVVYTDPSAETYMGEGSHIEESPYTQIWEMYKEQKEYKKSIEIYKEIVKRYPNDVMAYYYMGIVHHDKKEYTKAIKAYNESIKINPTAKSHHKLGMAYIDNKEYDNAIKSYTKAIELSPNNSNLYTDLFELQQMQNKPVDKKIYNQYKEKFENKKSNIKKNNKSDSVTEGWVYLGEYFDGKWEEQHLELKEDIEPSDLIGSLKILKDELSMKTEPYFGNILTQVEVGDKIKVMKVYNIGTYWWGYVEY